MTKKEDAMEGMQVGAVPGNTSLRGHDFRGRQGALDDVLDAHERYWESLGKEDGYSGEEQIETKPEGQLADLGGCNLEGMSFRGRDLQGVLLQGALIKGADFWGAGLAYVDFYRADVRDADFTGADLQFADLSYADTRGATGFSEDNLAFTDLSCAVVDDPVLIKAQREDSGKYRKDYTLDPKALYADLALHKAWLDGDGATGKASAVSFKECNLTGFDLSGCDLSLASFEYANVQDAVFTGARLEGARFKCAKRRNTLFDDAVVFDAEGTAHDGRKREHTTEGVKENGRREGHAEMRERGTGESLDSRCVRADAASKGQAHAVKATEARAR